MSIITAVFIVALAGIGAGTLTEIAKAIARRGGARDVADLSVLVKQQAAELEEARAMLASQGSQLAELQERMDFAERLLAQVRERKALGGVEPGQAGRPGGT